jgi:hypothetical protein
MVRLAGAERFRRNLRKRAAAASEGLKDSQENFTRATHGPDRRLRIRHGWLSEKLEIFGTTDDTLCVTVFGKYLP